ncbi:hypothetical protein NIES4071_29340 [Calothrix sp. NIES-4071]|nr:hypothetical protein NIES4071_29340 [Calothrix sp. NIES-4071]BAZ57254.1 hypothetical protein NIES4105_29280 [Calothrix sp. NIES-4105]
MKASRANAIESLKNPQYWLLAIAAGLISIHLTLTWKADNSDFLGNSFLFWLAVSTLVWDKRHKLNLESGIFASLLGISMIGILLIKSASMTSFGGFLYISPVIFALGLALLASGFQGLKQYKGELISLFFLGIPKLIPSSLINTSPLTAKASAFILWYTGFKVTRDGVNIYLPKGSVEVASGCSGIEQIFQMLGLGILFILMFSLSQKAKIVVPIVAATLGFLVNAGRVSLMAVIVETGDKQAFKYWHDGDGSLVFSLISVFLFGFFCWFLIRENIPNHQ